MSLMLVVGELVSAFSHSTPPANAVRLIRDSLAPGGVCTLPIPGLERVGADDLIRLHGALRASFPDGHLQVTHTGTGETAAVSLLSFTWSGTFTGVPLLGTMQPTKGPVLIRGTAVVTGGDAAATTKIGTLEVHFDVLGALKQMGVHVPLPAPATAAPSGGAHPPAAVGGITSGHVYHEQAGSIGGSGVRAKPARGLPGAPVTTSDVDTDKTPQVPDRF